MKSYIFWDITPCNPLEANKRFGETCRLHLQGRTTRQARNHHEAGSKEVYITMPRENDTNFRLDYYGEKKLMIRLVLYFGYIAVMREL
jgi:hypothetical protein